MNRKLVVGVCPTKDKHCCWKTDCKFGEDRFYSGDYDHSGEKVFDEKMLVSSTHKIRRKTQEKMVCKDCIMYREKRDREKRRTSRIIIQVVLQYYELGQAGD